MQSHTSDVTDDLLPREGASPILYQAAMLPPVQNLVNAANRTIGSACTAPGHSLEPHPEEQKMATQGTDVKPVPDIEKERNNIKPRKALE